MTKITTPPPRLICLPYAGGSSLAYRRWPRAFPSSEIVTIDYPGHLLRPDEKLARTMKALIERLHDALTAQWDRPFVLVGSSLGALIALEIARRAEQAGVSPTALVVLSCPAPSRLWKHPPIAGLGDEDFTAAFTQRYGGPVGEMLDDPDKRNVLMPIIRADMELFEDYTGQDHEPIDCDVVAVCGTEDPAASLNDTEAWRDFTQRTASVHQIPGTHFLVEEPAGPLGDLLRKVIS